MTAFALLPLTAMLGLGYLLTLLVIDSLFYVRPVLPPWYYLLNGCSALVILGLAFRPPRRNWVGRAALLATIGLLSVAPVLMVQVVVMQRPPSPATATASGPEALLLRTMPLLLMALILTAWQYGWRYVMLFSSGIALLTLGLHLYFFRPGGPSLLPPLIVVIIQTVSFLVVGYFISTLMARLQQQQASLAQANRQLTAYAATLEELTISRERNRMARELHDTVAHTLSALSVQLETVKAYWSVDPTAAQERLDQALIATRAGLQETRRALKSLRASPLQDLGLLMALRQLATETAARANLRLTLLAPEQSPALAPTVEQCIYRVAQEAIANVAHHANAKTLTVQLSCQDGILLRVSDDGQGFNPQEAQTAGHFGLAGMRERAQLAGGALTVTSQPGQGASVALAIKEG
ncbi:MAG: sensor histidine kinase [Caldilineaceae bacterium]